MDELEECIVELLEEVEEVEFFESELVEELEACLWYIELLLEGAAVLLFDPNASPFTGVLAPPVEFKFRLLFL